MPALLKTLLAADLDLLSRIARAWGLDSLPEGKTASANRICQIMLDESVFQEVIASLPEPIRAAWETLLSAGGHIPTTIFERQFGEIRTLGPSKRERENPDLKPVSISETLWYKGLIGKGFLDLPPEPQEFIFIADELRQLSSSDPQENRKFRIRPAADQKPKNIRLGHTAILDHLTDLLAAIRMQRTLPDGVFTSWGISADYLSGIAKTTRLLGTAGQPDPEKLKHFFSLDRVDAIELLYRDWFVSKTLNELRLLPGLKFEGSWKNDPCLPRTLLADILRSLNPDTWWSLSSLLSTIKSQRPDFQRLAGDYDSWFIKNENSNEYLRGFSHWDEVEGALIRFLVTGPFHWLGILDLSAEMAGQSSYAFRLSRMGADLLAGKKPAISIVENGEIVVVSAKKILIPPLTSRTLHYQVARFCRLDSITADGASKYEITPETLQKAAEQGLEIHQLLQFLDKNDKKPPPVSIKRLAERWQKHGLEAELSSAILLRFKDAAACEQFLASREVKKLDIEPLNDLVLKVNSAQVRVVEKTLLEMGILTQINVEYNQEDISKKSIQR